LPPPERRPEDRAVISPDLDEHASVLLWAGGIYNWFDPLTLIRAVARVVPEHPSLRLVFMSTTHPHQGVPPRMWMPQRARELADQLGVTGTTVVFHDGWVAYEERGRWLAAADCGVSTHYDHAETRYAFRTRILDYLWARLPIICSDGDFFADLVRERRLGWVVPPEDERALADAIRAFAQRGREYDEMRARIEAVAATMTWRAVAGPLLAYCSDLSRAADMSGPNRATNRHRRNQAGSVRTTAELARKGARLVRREGPVSAARAAARWWARRHPRQ
jgi:glycosyltransferase involved in cell wall biosynthesis